MEPQELAAKIKSVAEKLSAEINETKRNGKSHIFVPFKTFLEEDPELGDLILDEPEETLDIIGEVFNLKVRITNLPDSAKIPIWEIRQQLTKFIRLEGYVLKIGNILLRPTIKKYECPTCNKIITKIRVDEMQNIEPPKACSCGRRGVFKEIESKNTLVQQVVIEEDLMEITNKTIPKSKLVLLKEDLTSKDIDGKLKVGQKVVINGWLKTYAINKIGDLDTYLHANSIEFIERGWAVHKISNMNKVKEMADNPKLLEELKQSILPTLHGNDMAKEGLLLQLFGSPNIYDKDGFLEDRGCIHIAFFGNPGGGKSYAAKYISKFWPIYRFASAQTATGRGLIATVIYDKQLEKWVLIPGVVPTCHLGLNVIDELDKMNEEEYGYLNNAMNDLKVYVDKAAHGILDTDTSILATMNPVGRKFTDSPLYEQLALPADLVDRFDLIFVVKSHEEENEQRNVLRIGIKKRKDDDEDIKPIYAPEEIKDYIAYARQLTPIIPKEMEQIIEDRVMKFMKPSSKDNKTISNRIFSVILRLMYAYARIYRSKEVTVEHLNKTMDILIHTYTELDLMTKTGLLDIDRIEHVDMVKVNLHSEMRKIIDELSLKYKDIPLAELYRALPSFTDFEIEQMIAKLKQVGDIYEPRNGFVQKL